MRRPPRLSVLVLLLAAGCRARLPLADHPEVAPGPAATPAAPVAPPPGPAAAAQVAGLVEYYQISDG